jgi:hypothetical protein
LDTSVLNRPFDDQTQPRIALETQALRTILQLVEAREVELVSSSVLEYENSRNISQSRRQWVEQCLQFGGGRIRGLGERQVLEIKWYVPILNRLPRNHKFLLGDRMVSGLYDLLEYLLKARYERNKLVRLESLNSQLDVLRYQTRLLLEFELISSDRYEYIASLINGIGSDLGGWIRQQKGHSQPIAHTVNQKLSPIPYS